MFGGVGGGFCLGGAEKNEVKDFDYINANKPYAVLIIKFFKTTGRLKKLSGF